MSDWTLEERLASWRRRVPGVAAHGLLLLAAFLIGRFST